MQYFAIGEPGFKNSNWYKSIMRGLTEAKRQKRFSLTVLGSVEELKNTVLTDGAVFVIGGDSDWLMKTVSACRPYFSNRIVLLANHESRSLTGEYSTVSSDIGHSIRRLYAYFKYYSKRRIALYGINPRSSSDSYRKNSFLLCGGKEKDIFYNSASLENCYNSFSERAEEFDGVICVNDYAAISLIRRLDDPERYFIASCSSGSGLTEYFRPSITRAKLSFEEFGMAGVHVCKQLAEHPGTGSINVYIKSSFIPGETTGSLPFPADTEFPDVCPDGKKDPYYDDREIDEMIRAEALLSSCDGEDIRLIRGIIGGATYQALADELFLSVNGVKYKLKNMFDICGVKTRAEFTEFFEKYSI